MSDEEDYNSEEDADYVPSDGELGSEEENSGDEEDLSVLADDAGTAASSSSKKTGKRKQKKNDLAPRKRRGGIKLDEEEEAPVKETNGDAENAELLLRIKEEEEQKKTEREKKRANDLWSSFLTDVKTPAKAGPKATQRSTEVSQPVKSSSSSGTESAKASSSSTETPTPNQSNGSSNSEKITITKVFDFAGEEIKITKEVQADSKEAKEELKKQEQMEQQKAAAATSSMLSSSSKGVPSPSSVPWASPALLGVKRGAMGGGGGVVNVLNKIGKKPKMGTLEKSKMDWDAFKKKEGIDEDLKIHNKGKDGYIERMSFLNRTDIRQFEIERDLRLKRSGKR